MLLGGHLSATSVGEFHRLTMYAEAGELCTCGKLIHECAFWRAVAQNISGSTSGALVAAVLRHPDVMLRKDAIGPLRDLVERFLLLAGLPVPWRLARLIVGPAHSLAIEQSFKWFQAISRVEGTSVIVESTKDIRRMKLYYLYAPMVVRIVHLVRDGRAVSASSIRRTGCSMQEAATEWKDKNRRILAALRSVSAEHRLFVRYEDICNDPQAVMLRLFQFLNIAPEVPTVRLDKASRHNIAGNPMRFDRQVSVVSEDDRWRDELSEEELRVFAEVAGGLNEYFGYR